MCLLFCAFTCIVIFCVVLIILKPLNMATTGLSVHNAYSVQPDDKFCAQLPCYELKYFIKYSHFFFVSNTTLFFSEGEYYYFLGNLMIQNVTNFSLIGTPNISDPTSPLSVMKCSPDRLIHFHNVSGLLIKDLKFQGCGGLISNYDHSMQETLWAALSFWHCYDLKMANVYIYNPMGYGVLAKDIVGNNCFENITVIIGRNNRAIRTCSYGAKWHYSNSFGNITKPAIVIIDNIIIKYLCTSYMDANMDRGFLEFEIDRHDILVYIEIKNSNFYKLNGRILNVNILSLSYSHIRIYNCGFVQNSAHQVINFQHILPSSNDTINKCLDAVTLQKTVFLHNSYSDYLEDPVNSSLLTFKVFLNHQLNVNYTLRINFNDLKFYANRNALLQVVPNVRTQNHSPVMVSVEGYFNAVSNSQQISRLFSLTSTQLYFNGIIRFINNTASEILHLTSSALSFSNITVFNNNTCKNLISLNYKCYLKLTGRANIAFTHNTAHNQLIYVPIKNNNPYPYCLFQYYSPMHNSYKDFKISMLDNDGDSELLFKLSYCKWALGAAFQNIKPSVVNREIVKVEYKNDTSYQLGAHTAICYCPSSSQYNCSVDQLGDPVYPGENLIVDLCLPYNHKETAIVYIDTYNDNLPKSACTINDHKSTKHEFHYKKRKSVNVSIASAQPTVCELFLTAQPNLFMYYDAFYVLLLPCPLGFTLQHGICNCDPNLRNYIDDCMISDQTVTRLSGTYMLGIEAVNYSTNLYKVSIDCPIYYCLPGPTRLNLLHPDAQCQPHRTGLLCSQCAKGYSVVFGSNQCKKCSNFHLLYLLYFMLTGVILIFILFLFNLTVTAGHINSLIFYVNIVRLSSLPMHLPERLVSPLLIYIYIANIETYVERCLYNGMDRYVKMFIAFAYPLYFLIIASLIILGSRYSIKLHRLTFNKVLPVLATLFLLTYTSILYLITIVPSYTAIITIPHQSSRNIWLLDPTIPLWGWKFLLLISVCILLFLFLLMFNAIMLFTKPLMRFKYIHRFKPLIDAFQGPFKTQYLYWVGLQLLIRNIIASLSVLEESINLTTSCIITVTLSVIHGYIQPNKSKIVNLQEMLLLYNFALMCIFLVLNKNETLNVIAVNVMVGLSFVHCVLILIYHVFVFMVTIPCTNARKVATNIWNFMEKIDYFRRQRWATNESLDMQIHKAANNLVNFREPLIGEDL